MENRGGDVNRENHGTLLNFEEMNYSRFVSDEEGERRFARRNGTNYFEGCGCAQSWLPSRNSLLRPCRSPGIPEILVSLEFRDVPRSFLERSPHVFRVLFHRNSGAAR